MKRETLLLNLIHCNLQISADNIKYLAEKLGNAAEKAKPTTEELEACYYEADNISSVITECCENMQHNLNDFEQIVCSLTQAENKG